MTAQASQSGPAAADGPATPGPAFDASRLDGLVVTAVTSSWAVGCGGVSGVDDDGGRSTFVFPGELDSAHLDALEADWGELWAQMGRVSSRAGRLLEQLGVQLWAPPEPAPVWGETWPGTRREWSAAAKTADAHLAEHRRNVDTALQAARVALFRRAGAIAVRSYLSAAAHWVHDFGCRCGHLTGGWGGPGPLRLTVVGGVVYGADQRVDVAGVVAEAEADAERAAQAATAKNAEAVAQVPPEELTAVAGWPREEDAELDMTFAEWVAHREQRRRRAAAVLADPGDVDWHELRRMFPRLRRLLVDPATASSWARRQVFDRAEVDAVDAADAAAIAAAAGLL